MADITDLILEDHQWFRRQFFYLDEAKTNAELTATRGRPDINRAGSWVKATSLACTRPSAQS